MPPKADKKLFAPLERKTVVTDVIEKITLLVENGEIPEGYRLPSERELAGTFQVSRNSIREALQALASLRVVEIRPGVGTFVLETGGNFYDVSDATLLHLNEVRKIIETGILPTVLEKIRPADIAKLEETVDAHKKAANEGGSTYILDLLFHQRLLQICANPVLERMFDSVWKARSDTVKYTASLPKKAQEAAAAHRKILESIKAEDLLAAQAAMLEHLEYTRGTVLEEEPSDDGRLAIQKLEGGDNETDSSCGTRAELGKET